jgi:hypothetical protein
MPISATKEQALAKRHYYKLPNGTDTWVSSYIGVNSVERRSTGLAPREPVGYPPPLEPIAFLVEQAANMSIPGHYHQADQFQVFLTHGGKFGIKPIDALTIHYAAAFSPYAPINAEQEKVMYFTLRNGWDPGAKWMPESKDHLLANKKTYRSGVGHTPALFGEADGPQNLTEIERSEVVPFNEDGMGVALYQCPAHTRFTGPAPAQGAGQYWLVLKGECQIAGSQSNLHALSFVSPDEEAVEIATTASPVAIMLLQFSKKPNA